MSKNIYVYCEGQTEESFVNRVLSPWFAVQGISCLPIVCTTSRKISKQMKYRGGATSYARMKHELTTLCSEHSKEIITTLFDYYGLPSDTPALNNSTQPLYDRIESIERAVESDIGKENLKFNLAVHEFEGLLFSKPEAFELIAEPSVVARIIQIRNDFENPEYINRGIETAPSKRILNLIPEYMKIPDGTILSELIGIQTMRDKCPHFDCWIKKLCDRSH